MSSRRRFLAFRLLPAFVLALICMQSLLYSWVLIYKVDTWNITGHYFDRNLKIRHSFTAQAYGYFCAHQLNKYSLAFHIQRRLIPTQISKASSKGTKLIVLRYIFFFCKFTTYVLTSLLQKCLFLVGVEPTTQSNGRAVTDWTVTSDNFSIASITYK